MKGPGKKLVTFFRLCGLSMTCQKLENRQNIFLPQPVAFLPVKPIF